MALPRLRVRAAAGESVGADRRSLRVPVVRSGTPLEVAEVAWIAEGVSREGALSIPAVLACRNLLVGSVVQMRLFRYRAGERLDPGYLLDKPDPSTTLPATMSGTVDDLIFNGRGYWRVLDRDAEGVVTRARWTPFRDVTPLTRSAGGSYAVLTGYQVAGVGELPPEDLIRFDAPAPGVLDVGARTLASALELESAARRLASVELPAGTLTNTSGHTLGDAEAQDLVAGFQAARRENGIAWLEGVEYKRESLSPADLQLVEARAAIATDVARLFNVPVAMIGASPSGNASALLYSNLSQQLSLLVASGCAPYLRCIEATLGDVLPRGQSVAFDVQTFLRSDPSAAADYSIALLGAGIIDRTEARALLGIPSSPPAGDLTPGSVSQ